MHFDYYPFGMVPPGRQYTAGLGYRYGFNGKENDNEVKGEGNQQDYGMRIYDPRLGRFLSVDPLSKSFPHYTPYQFAGNKPIAFIDLDGGEDKHYSLEFNFSPDSKLHNISFTEIPHLNAGKHAMGNYEWEVPVGPLGKGNAIHVRVSYNPTPQSVITQTILGVFIPKPKGFFDFFSPQKDNDIGEGYYLSGEEGGAGDPFGPGAKKVDNIPDADKLISMLGGGGSEKGIIRSVQSGQGAEKIAAFFESLSGSIEAGVHLYEAIELAKGKAEPDPNTIYCITCSSTSSGNFLLDSNGHPTYVESKKPASDTVTAHEDPPKKKTDTTTNNSVKKKVNDP